MTGAAYLGSAIVSLGLWALVILGARPLFHAVEHLALVVSTFVAVLRA